MKDVARRTWGGRRLERLVHDVRYAARGLRRAPAFTAVAVFTLAFGIGAAVAIYSVVDALLIHPLPFPGSERLVFVREFIPGFCSDCYEVPIGNYADLRRALSGSMDLVASRAWSPVLLGTERTEVVGGASVSPDFFRVLGAAPERGRAFTSRANSPDGREILLSDAAWRGRFGADPGIIGRDLTLDGLPFTVVGVMPPGYGFPPETEVWSVLNLDSALAPNARQGPPVDVFGRLHPGISFGQAAGEVRMVGAQLTLAYADAMRDRRIDLQPMRLWHEDTRPALLVLIVAVGLVLVIACINLAGLLLARLTARRRELALRVALGASAGRIARQLLTEALLLSVLGALGGIGVAAWAVPTIRGAVPEELASFEPGWPHMQLNGHVLVFAVLLAVIAAILVGTGPAVHFSRPHLSHKLEGGARGVSQPTRLRQGFIIAEVALSLVLLSAAALLVRSVANMASANVGIRPDHVLTMRLERGPADADTPGLRSSFFHHLIEQVEATPGVIRAGSATALPLSHRSNWEEFAVEGRPAPRPEDRPRARVQYMSAEYFATLGIPVVGGRPFRTTDDVDTAGVAIVSRALARGFLAGTEPIGQHILIDGRKYRVIGIAGDVYHDGPSDAPDAEIDLLQPGRQRAADLAVKTTIDPLVAAPAVLAAIRRYDPTVAINRVRSMTDIEAEFMSPYRLMLGLMMGFALLALVMAAVGLFGVVSYAAEQRTREFGIRLALGAQRRDIGRLVLAQGMRLAFIGAAIGITGALVVTRLIRFLLYRVGVADPLSLLAVTSAMCLVTLGSAYLPARRATRVDPNTSLRAD